MSCGCNQIPCQCPPSVLETLEDPCPPAPCTLCDQAWLDNVWVERADPTAVGVCLLDTLTEDQVINIIERDDKARADLLRVTSNQRLLELARIIPRLPEVEECDREQTLANRSGTPASIPFYAIFRGQPPFNQ
jgi:hypothetical protein